MNIAVILSGGTGSRIGLEIPKQYIEVNGRPMIDFCLETFFAHPEVDAVQIVADKAWREYILGFVSQAEKCLDNAGAVSQTENPLNSAGNIFQTEKRLENTGKFRGFSDPGPNRQLSIYQALTDMREYADEGDTVIIHDAARPFVTAEQISRCLGDMKGHEGVLSVLPMKDTVYITDGKHVSSLLDRERIYAGQAPEFFLFGKYYAANQALLPDRILSVNGSTEPAILAGMDVCLSQGDEGNFKVTTERDLEMFRRAVGEF